MEKQIRHYDIIVKGRVQGVGYRYYATKIAAELGIKGFVKNMPDGSVYIEAEGNHENLIKFLNKCRKGPSWAYVEKLTYHEAPLSNFHGFSVKY